MEFQEAGNYCGFVIKCVLLTLFFLSDSSGTHCTALLAAVGSP
jgi:hypothetical protein